MKKILITLAIIGLGSTVGASLFCSDLANCNGSAGCSDFGSLSGCTITCSGGGFARCKFNI